MCGFNGIVAERPLTGSDLRWLERGAAQLRHRGPDDEGFVVIGAVRARTLRGDDSASHDRPHIAEASPEHEHVALGARRLAIIDLGPGGHLPMTDQNGNWLVFNGEIYNYRELRQHLITRGHGFTSASDSEVLLGAYAEWGTGCLEHLNGMWAFALWDRHAGRLFCARDRFGEKQLYYHRDGEGSFRFASEIAPLRLATAGQETVDRSLVWDFLLYGLADHTAGTFFTGIAQLAPGTFLTVRPGEPPRVAGYYDLARRRTEPPADLAGAAEGLRQRLSDSVSLRLRSDVPVASFFSGGLDSASIVSLADHILAAGNGNSPYRALRTYTHVYPAGHRYDESPRVRAALSRLQRVEAEFVPASLADFERDLLALVASQEQPFHNVSIFASYRLLRHIRERGRIKVVLTGEAGDELLAGYPRVYLPLHLGGLAGRRQWGAWIREARAWGWPTALKATAQRLLHAWPRRAGLERWRNPAVAVLRPEFLRAYRQRDAEIHEQWRGLDLHARLLADLTRFNLPQLLRHLDRNAMQWSIETRVPFLDHHLVEFICSLPEEWKLHRGYSKYVLRQAMAAALPDAITWNRGKLGFGMAEQFWLRECLDLLRPSAAFGEFVDVRKLEKQLRTSARPPQAYWLPLSLGLWLQTAFPGAH